MSLPSPLHSVSLPHIKVCPKFYFEKYGHPAYKPTAIKLLVRVPKWLNK
jgi:hypothetical protein